MNKSTKTIVAVIVLIVIIGGAIIIFKPSKTNAPSSSTGVSSVPDTTPVASTITYNGSSFSLSANTIKSGESIKIVNSSQTDLSFNSDPHPVHTDNPELNVGNIAAGQSRTIKLTAKGTWGFHNHLDASQHGTITVQ
jgi:hypothetical protein